MDRLLRSGFKAHEHPKKTTKSVWSSAALTPKKHTRSENRTEPSLLPKTLRFHKQQRILVAELCFAIASCLGLNGLTFSGLSKNKPKGPARGHLSESAKIGSFPGFTSKKSCQKVSQRGFLRKQNGYETYPYKTKTSK